MMKDNRHEKLKISNNLLDAILLGGQNSGRFVGHRRHSTFQTQIILKRSTKSAILWRLSILSSGLDGLVVKVHHDHQVLNKTIYIALAINMEGYKELLGIWISEHEGASFWAQVLTELNRGVKDVFVFCVNGLTGFPDAIKGVFPKSEGTQTALLRLGRKWNEKSPAIYALWERNWSKALSPFYVRYADHFPKRLTHFLTLARQFSPNSARSHR